MAGAPPRPFRALALRLAFELVVTFIGVSAAFFVDSYRDRREAQARTRQVYLALDREIATYVTKAPALSKEIDRRLAVWDSAHAAGRHVAPAELHVPGGAGAERIPTIVWDATLASGGLNVVDPTLFYSLAEHYNRLNSISLRYARYNEFVEREILPREGTPDAFYDPRTGALLPEYVGSMGRMRDIGDAMRLSVKDGLRLRAQLANALRRLPP